VLLLVLLLCCCFAAILLSHNLHVALSLAWMFPAACTCDVLHGFQWYCDATAAYTGSPTTTAMPPTTTSRIRGVILCVLNHSFPCYQRACFTIAQRSRVALFSASAALSSMSTSAAAAPTPTRVTTLYDFSARDIDGKEVSLAVYKASPVAIVVNVASECVSL
jgi:hypothetical protein